MPDAHAQHHYTPSELEKIKQCEFAQGVAYAVARLLRDFDRVVEAKEIWRDSGCSLDGVDPYDAKPIAKEIKRGWGRKDA